MAARQKRICLILGPAYVANKEFGEKIAAVRQEVIVPALSLFPEYDVRYEDRCYLEADYDPNDIIVSADLVIADLTAPDLDTYHALGIRHATERNTIVLTAVPRANEVATWPGHYSILCRLDNPEIARNNLIRLIRSFTNDPPPRLSRRVSSRVLADRIEEIATAIAELRINSTSEHIEKLHEISRHLKQQGDSADRNLIHDTMQQVLSIIQHIDEIVGSTKLGKLVISGALAGLVAGGGAPAAAVFGLSLAVWQGSDYFKAALDKYLLGKRAAPTKRAAPRRPAPKPSAPRGSRRHSRRSGEEKDKAE